MHVFYVTPKTDKEEITADILKDMLYYEFNRHSLEEIRKLVDIYFFKHKLINQ